VVGEQGRDPVDQREVADVVGPELGLEAVDRLPRRRRHDAGVGDDGVERPAVRQQLVRTGAHAPQRRQVERDRLQAAAALHSGLPDRRDGGLTLRHVTDRADNAGAAGSQRARRFEPDPRRDTRDEESRSGEIDSGQHVVGGRGCPELPGHWVVLTMW
jgi:hypothetical protein